eukprot:1136906-Prorocentrum_lima.AAC.1
MQIHRGVCSGLVDELLLEARRSHVYEQPITPVLQEALLKQIRRREQRRERRARRLERNRQPWELTSSDSNYEPSDDTSNYVPSSDSDYGGPYSRRH